MRKISLLLLLVLFLSGCATPYQKYGLSGGYSDTQLQKDVFRVGFNGNAYVSKGTVQNYLLRRCAEVTIENGYDYFVIFEEENYAAQSSYTTPTQTTYQGSSYGSGTSSGHIYGRTIQSSGTYSGQTYGTSTTYGGQTYHFSKPVSVCVIKCFKGEKPENLPNTFDAKELIKYLTPAKK